MPFYSNIHIKRGTLTLGNANPAFLSDASTHQYSFGELNSRSSAAARACTSACMDTFHDDDVEPKEAQGKRKSNTSKLIARAQEGQRYVQCTYFHQLANSHLDLCHTSHCRGNWLRSIMLPLLLLVRVVTACIRRGAGSSINLRNIATASTDYQQPNNVFSPVSRVQAADRSSAQAKLTADELALSGYRTPKCVDTTVRAKAVALMHLLLDWRRHSAVDLLPFLSV